MKIVFLACLNKNKAGNSFGGAEKSIINLSNWVANNTDNDVYLVSVQGNEKPFEISDKVKYTGACIESKTKISTHLQIFKNCKNVIKKIKPDVIISFWIQPLFYSILCCKKNTKLIYSERNDPNLEYGKIAKVMRFFVMNKCENIVFQTHDAQQYFNDSIIRKSTVIQNPTYIRMNDYEYNEKTDNRIVTVGRLNNQKNQKLLIEAFNCVKDKYPQATLEIYGEGDLRNSLQEQINNLELVNRVFLKGACANVLDKIYGAKLFVLPSLYEGMPNALIEAMSLGITVLSSDCPCGRT